MPLGSWYSQLPGFGWFDKGDRPGSNALGVPDSQQGIALPTRASLGKWFLVTPPGGNQPMPFQQTDTGPAPWTGRGVDVSAAAANQMGYTPNNFPTDANFKVEPIDTTGLGLAAGYMGGVPGENNTAVAQGPPQGRKMPTSLLDMFQPTNAAGEPSSFNDAIASQRQGLIGLGLGLMSPAWEGQTVIGNALKGYQAGSAQDATTAARAQALAHQKTQDARQAAQDAFTRQMAEKQFARSGEGDFSKVAREIGLAPNTPEYAAAAQKYYQGKTEGDWSIAEVQHPLYPDQKVPVWANKRTRETIPFTPGSAPPGTTGVAANPDTFTSGTAPVYGAGGDYRASPAAAISPSATPGTAAGRAWGPPPPGANYAEYTKEKTKEYVKQQAADEQKAKRAGMIDPVGEDISRVLNQTAKLPAMNAGWFGSLMANIPGSYAHDTSKLIDTIKSNASLEKLQELKAQSQTGASGLGAVSDREQSILQGAIGNLDQSQTPAQFLHNLERVQRVRHEIIHGAGTAPPERFPVPEEQRAPAAPSPAATSQATPTADAVKALKANPQYRDQFDAKYGPGAAMRVFRGE